MNPIKTRIIKIGNSQGVRIPKLLLEQADLGEEVELELKDKGILIRANHFPRNGWEDKFIEMAEWGDDSLLDETAGQSSWDEEDWEW